MSSQLDFCEHCKRNVETTNWLNYEFGCFLVILCIVVGALTFPYGIFLWWLGPNIAIFVPGTDYRCALCRRRL